MTNPTEGRLQQRCFLTQADRVTEPGLVDEAPACTPAPPLDSSRARGAGPLFFPRHHRSGAPHSRVCTFIFPAVIPTTRPDLLTGRVLCRSDKGTFTKLDAL